MIEVLFAVWLAIVGVLLLAPTSRHIPPWGAAFLAPIIATALFILVGLGLASVSLFSVALCVVVVSIAAMAMTVLALSRRDVTLGWLARAIGGATSVAMTVAIVAWRIPMARFTTDSYHYLMSAVALVRSGTLEGVSDSLLLKRQLATPLLHTLGVESGRGYVSFWTPLLGVSTFGSMTWLALDGLRVLAVPRRWQWAIVAPALAFVLTANRVVFHFFYINGHMLFASLLLAGVGLGWLAVRAGSRILLLPASVMFGALVPLRAESTIVVGAFLVAFLSSQEIPARWRWALLAPTVAASLLWNGWVLPQLLSSTSLDTLKSPLSGIAVAAGLVVLVTMSSIRSLRWAVRSAPWIAIGTLVILLGTLVWRDPQIMVDTMVGMSSAMTVTGFWGTFWMIVPPLFFAAIIVGFPRDRYMLVGLLAFVLIIPVLAYLRGAAFHDGTGDSANRMLMHVVPLLMLVVMLAAGTAAGSTASGDGDASQSLEQSRGTTGDVLDSA